MVDGNNIALIHEVETYAIQTVLYYDCSTYETHMRFPF